VSLEHLWAGWRSEYIESATEEDRRAGDGAACVFCGLLASGRPDTETHVVWRHPAGRVVGLLNAYPYASGHLMVMPVRHARALDELLPGEAGDLWSGVTAAVSALRTAYRPDGINVGINLGRAAGAGIPGHLHVHAVPRWAGDTNFMTSVAGTRVLPESLDTSARRVREAWAATPPV